MHLACQNLPTREWSATVNQLDIQNAERNELPPNLSEQPAQQATCKIIHNSTAKSPIGECGCLTELVAP